MTQRPILFCATGVRHTVGGIASANQNVLAALETLAAEAGREVRTLTLLETADEPGYRGFGGDKARFMLAAMRGSLGAALVVVDHVRLAVPLLALPRFLRPSIVICAHGSEATWRIRPSSRRAFERADIVLTNSHYTLARMGEYVPQFRGVACPLGLAPGFELAKAPPAADIAPMTLTAADGQPRELGSQVLLLVARLDAQEREKGHQELMALMPRLQARHPGAQLVFAGDGGDRAALLELARASGAADSIFLPGRVDAADLSRLYRKAYAYVMPSRQEGFGLVYLEAMNAAKPCLACRDDGGGEVVVDGETGVLIPRAFTEDELLGAIDHLLVDPARARGYGEAGWRRLLEFYTGEAHQGRVAGLLRPFLSRT